MFLLRRFSGGSDYKCVLCGGISGTRFDAASPAQAAVTFVTLSASISVTDLARRVVKGEISLSAVDPSCQDDVEEAVIEILTSEASNLR